MSSGPVPGPSAPLGATTPPPPGGCLAPQPVGYYCSRTYAHNGSCSTYPVPPSAPVQTWTSPKERREGVKSGGPVGYYLVQVTNPNQGKVAYQAECGDIIEALKMDFNQGCAFKALWRAAASKILDASQVKQGQDELYDAQKVEFYGMRWQATILGHKPGKKVEATVSIYNKSVQQRVRNVNELVKQLIEKTSSQKLDAVDFKTLTQELFQLGSIIA